MPSRWDSNVGCGVGLILATGVGVSVAGNHMIVGVTVAVCVDVAVRVGVVEGAAAPQEAINIGKLSIMMLIRILKTCVVRFNLLIIGL
jgi:uncharacterized membrane protein YgaE (UPF0421/DUF939 family)